jgi:membrane associated rhomboid family serine protease
VIPIKDNIPTDRLAIVTIALIVVNVIAYLLAIRHGGSLLNGPSPDVVSKYGAIPYSLTHGGQHCADFVSSSGFVQQDVGVFCDGQALPDGSAAHISGSGYPPGWATVITSMFMHGSILHIGFNMLFLWIFGNNVEDSMGPVRFLGFYIVGGLAALALQIAVDPNSTAPTLGASGAIAAVLGGYLVLYPRARVLTLVIIIFFFTIVELPAVVLLLVWFALNALLPAIGEIGQVGTTAGGVAYFAHLGGFVFGLLTIKLLATRRKEFEPRLPVY